MDLGLKGKVAIVGGASMGIGYGIARTLRSEGARVAITARREPGLAQAPPRSARRDRGRGPADRRRLPPRRGLRPRRRDHGRRALGGIDILVNNDGAPPLGELTSFDDAAWAKAVEQNLMYVVRMARARVPHMTSARRRQHPQYHRHLGHPAHRRLRPVGRDLGRRHRLCQDAVARGRARQHQRQHHLPRLHRDAAAREGVRGGRRRPAGRCARKLEAEVPMGRIGTVDGHRRHGRAAGLAARALHHRHGHPGRRRPAPRRCADRRAHALHHDREQPTSPSAGARPGSGATRPSSTSWRRRPGASRSRGASPTAQDRITYGELKDRSSAAPPSCARSASSAATSSPSSCRTASPSRSSSSRSS